LIRRIEAEVSMTEEECGLFGELAKQEGPWRDAGLPRFVEAKRDEIVFDRFEFDALIGVEHPARAIWAWVEQADLSVLYAQIRARAHRPGRPAADPRVALALWLYACVEGVGSARQLDRLTQEHHGFRWLRGGVPLNYHLLSDFRWDAAAVADRLLSEGVAALWSAGLVKLASLAHDGVRIRAAAGASSFRRVATLERLLREVEERIARLKQEIDAEPDASNRRQRAAQERAARERQERVAAALQALRDLQAQQAAAAAAKKPADRDPPDGGAPAGEKKSKKNKQPRRSTTDAQARVMRMPDGGWRPAYNLQLTSDLDTGVIVALSVDTSGSDGGLMAPALAQVEQRYAHRPLRWLADGGFTALDDIVALARKSITVFCPLKPRRNPKYDPAALRYGDPPEIADWRRRMVDDANAGTASWMRRRGEHERINANFRRQGLQQFNVRGTVKVKAVSLLHALANNIMAAVRLRAAAA
jgi:transposase